MERVVLDYINREKEVCRTVKNFPIVKDVYEYDHARIRNRVIIKIDIIEMLTKLFSKETLQKYRNLAFNLVSFNLESIEECSEYLKTFYLTDSVFHKFLSEVYFFDKERSMKSLLELLSDRMIEQYNNCFSDLDNSLSSQRCKFILESEGYVYYAVPDENITIYLNKACSVEVLSYAKVWDCNIQGEQCTVFNKVC